MIDEALKIEIKEDRWWILLSIVFSSIFVPALFFLSYIFFQPFLRIQNLKLYEILIFSFNVILTAFAGCCLCVSVIFCIIRLIFPSKLVLSQDGIQFGTVINHYYKWKDVAKVGDLKVDLKLARGEGITINTLSSSISILNLLFKLAIVNIYRIASLGSTVNNVNKYDEIPYIQLTNGTKKLLLIDWCCCHLKGYKILKILNVYLSGVNNDDKNTLHDCVNLLILNKVCKISK